MSAMSALDLLFQELREALQNYASSEEIKERYLAVCDEFPMLTMGDVVYEFELWLKQRENEERELARRAIEQKFGIVVLRNA